jgi:hypothetical protein
MGRFEITKHTKITKDTKRQIYFFLDLGDVRTNLSPLISDQTNSFFRVFRYFRVFRDLSFLP